MNLITDPQQALALINRSNILALLAAQSNTQEPPQAAQTASPQESNSKLDADGEINLKPDAEDEMLDWQPGAKFILSCRSARQNGRFRLVVTNPPHNHGRIDVRATPKACKAFITPEIREYIREQSAASTQPQEIINRHLIHHPGLPIKERDIYNIKAKIRKENLHGLSPLHALFAELENEEDGPWAYNAGWDEDQKLLHLFLAHRDSLDLVQCYYDVLVIDATCKTNLFNMPVVQIIGFDMFQKSLFHFYLRSQRRRSNLALDP